MLKGFHAWHSSNVNIEIWRISNFAISSSVARGGRGGGAQAPLIGLWSMQNRTFLLLFMPIFGEKLKTAPPMEIGCRSREVDVVMRCEKVFEFPILAEKSDSISVKTSFFFSFGDHLFLGWKNLWILILAEIRWRPLNSLLDKAKFEILQISIFTSLLRHASISVKTFFFLETNCFWAEKTFECPSFPRNFVSIFGQTVWNWFKNNKNSGQGRLHFSQSFKKVSPFFQILATRLAISRLFWRYEASIALKEPVNYIIMTLS